MSRAGRICLRHGIEGEANAVVRSMRGIRGNQPKRRTRHDPVEITRAQAVAMTPPARALSLMQRLFRRQAK